MNPFISEEALNQLREDYPKGAIVVLDKMEDSHRPVPAGTKGTVKYVDDAGTVHVSWENGQGLGLVYGEDEYHLYKEGEQAATKGNLLQNTNRKHSGRGLGRN